MSESKQMLSASLVAIVCFPNLFIGFLFGNGGSGVCWFACRLPRCCDVQSILGDMDILGNWGDRVGRGGGNRKGTAWLLGIDGIVIRSNCCYLLGTYPTEAEKYLRAVQYNSSRIRKLFLGVKGAYAVLGITDKPLWDIRIRNGYPAFNQLRGLPCDSDAPLTV